MFKHLLVSIVLIVTFALIPTISFAYTSKICAGTTCTAKEVGPFMDGISQECGNSGTCQLSDIMLLITNVGNYVLGIIGAIVLLMYTIGGFNILVSDKLPNIQNGKKMISIATFGLFIVFFAYLGINTMVSILKTGNVSSPGDVQACIDGRDNDPCGDNMVCSQGSCVSLCELNTRDSGDEFSCLSIDPDNFQYSQRRCQPSGCPSGSQCCSATLAPEDDIPASLPGEQP